jgi:FkbM family methyltransferase
MPANDPIMERGHLRLIQARHGLFLYNRNDRFIGRSLETYGEWCEAELALLRPCVRSGSLVLDIGANIGTHTVPLAKWAGPAGRVIAFEPQRLVFQTLCANVALNGLTNVVCLNKGVGRAPGMVRVPVLNPEAALNFGSVRLAGTDGGEPTEIMTVDGLGLPACHLMKIDVEGMEAEVLEGAAATIARCRPVLFVENNTTDGAGRVIEGVFRLGYRAWWHLGRYFAPDNHFSHAADIFASYRPEANMLCLPAGSAATVGGLEPVLGPEDSWQAARDRLAKTQGAG